MRKLIHNCISLPCETETYLFIYRDKDQYQIVLEVTNKINQFRRILGCDPCADKKYWEEIMEMSHNIYINNEVFSTFTFSLFTTLMRVYNYNSD